MLDPVEASEDLRSIALLYYREKMCTFWACWHLQHLHTHESEFQISDCNITWYKFTDSGSYLFVSYSCRTSSFGTYRMSLEFSPQDSWTLSFLCLFMKRSWEDFEIFWKLDRRTIFPQVFGLICPLHLILEFVETAVRPPACGPWPRWHAYAEETQQEIPNFHII